ncbi:MAG: RNA polymerase sigma factor, partial [Kineosporiaceae bacterium]
MGTTPDGPGHAPEGRRDADLAVAAASGDREALAAIYDRYASRVFALAARQLRDRDAAADVTQDVFLTAARRIGGLADPERLRPWIFAVTRHRIVDHVRRSRRVVPTDTIEDVDSMELRSEGSEGFDRVRSDELRGLLADSSAGLDDRDRMVLELAYGAELAGRDLAHALGVRENTAHQLLSRARQRLRTSLGALLVARQGRRDCEELAALLQPWDGTLSTVWRKRVARHVDGCGTCSDTERRVLSPAALGSAFPLVAVPEGVREQVLAGLDPASAPAGAATRGDAAARDGDAAPGAGWRRDGFPPDDGEEWSGLAALGHGRRPHRTAGVLLAVAGVAVLGAVGTWWGVSALAGAGPVSDELAAAPAAPLTPSPAGA